MAWFFSTGISYILLVETFQFCSIYVYISLCNRFISEVVAVQTQILLMRTVFCVSVCKLLSVQSNKWQPHDSLACYTDFLDCTVNGTGIAPN